MKPTTGIVDFLLAEVALCGTTGANPSNISNYVSSYFQFIGNSDKNDDEDIGLPTPKLNIDRPYLEQVWSWLVRDPSIRVGNDGSANKLTLVEIEKRNAEIASRLEVDPQDSLELIRIYASEHQVWFALAGHEPDIRRISPHEFALLSIIGSHREQGVLQPDLCRITGQDKRSVPPRTQKLADAGYIVKITVVARGTKTSKLYLKRFEAESVESAGPPKDETPAGTPKKKRHRRKTDKIIHPRVKARQDELSAKVTFVRHVTDVLSACKVAFWEYLKICLNISDTYPSLRFLEDLIKGLEHAGCVKRITTPATEDSKACRAIEFVSRPTDSICLEIASAIEFPVPAGASIDNATPGPTDTSSVPKATTQETTSHKTNKGKESNDVNPNPAGGGDQLGEVDVEPYNEPGEIMLWDPDRQISHVIRDVVRRYGSNGITNAELVRRIAGRMYRRPIEHAVHRLGESWELSQPAHLRHLGLIKDTKQVNRLSVFIHYTLDQFQSLVDSGKASWNSVQTNKKRQQPESAPDKHGFPALQDSSFQSPGVCLADSVEQYFGGGGKIARGVIKRAFNGTNQSFRQVSSKPKGRPRKFPKQGLPANAEELDTKELTRIKASQRAAQLYQKKKRQSSEATGEATPATPERTQTPQSESMSHHSVIEKTPKPSIAKKTQKASQHLPNGSGTTQIPDQSPQTKSLEDQSLQVQSLQNQPPTTQYIQTQSLQDQSLQTQSLQTQSLQTQSLQTQSLQTQSLQTQSLQTQSLTKPMSKTSTSTPRPARVRKLTKKAHESSVSGKTEESPALIPEVLQTQTYQQQASSIERPSQGFYVGRECLLKRNGIRGRQPRSKLWIFKSTRIKELCLEAPESNREPIASTDNLVTSSDSTANDSHQASAPDPNTAGLQAVVLIPLPAKQPNVTIIDPHTSNSHDHQPLKNSNDNEHAYSIYAPEPETVFNTVQSDLPDIDLDTSHAVEVTEPPLVETSPMRPFSQTLNISKAMGGQQNASEITPLPQQPEEPRSETNESNSMLVQISQPQSGHDVQEDGENNESQVQDENNKSPMTEGLFEKPKDTSDSSCQQDSHQESNHLLISDKEATQVSSAETTSREDKNLKELLPEPRQETGNQVGKMTLGGGSVAARRREIILTVLESAGGVFPGDRELWYPFTTAWMREHNGIKPDRRTITAVVKNLVNHKMLRQYTFSFQTKQGTASIRNILALPDYGPDHPKVKEVEKNIVENDPKLYIPEGVDVSDELRSTGPNASLADKTRPLQEPEARTAESRSRQNDNREVSVLDSNAVIDPRLASNTPTTGRTKKRKNSATQDKVPQGILKKRKRSKSARVSFAVDPNLNNSQAFPGSFSTLDLSLAGEQSSESSNLADPFYKLIPAEVVPMLEPVWQLDLPPTFSAFDTPPLVEPHVSAFPTNPNQNSHTFHLWEPNEAPDLIAQLTQAALGDNPEIELYQNGPPSIEPSGKEQYQMEPHQMESHEVEPHQVEPYQMESLQVEPHQVEPHQMEPIVDHTEALHIPFNQAGDIESLTFEPPTPDSTSPSRFVPISEESPRKRRAPIPASARPRRLTTLIEKLKDQLKDPEIVEAGSSAKKLRLRGPQQGRLNGEKGRRFYIAVVIVRTLLGGLERKIDWKFVTKILEPEFTYEHIRRAWNGVREQHKNISDKMAEEFQDMFLKAYSAGHIPPINFDDLESYDWKGLHNWTVEKFDSVTTTEVELPSSRTELEGYYTLQDASRREQTDYWEVVHKSTMPRRLFSLHKFPWGQSLDKSPLIRDTDSHDLVKVARTWIRANVLTDVSTYDGDEASRKLRLLGESVCKKAFSELATLKVIAQESKGRLGPFRSHDISESWVSRLKGPLEFTDFQKAATYKRILDESFRTGGKVFLKETVAKGEVAVIINLEAHGRIRCVGHNIPKRKLGLTPNGGYKTRDIPKKDYQFPVELIPTSSYIYGAPVQCHLEPPRCQPHITPSGVDITKIPLWYDFNNDLMPALWGMSCAAVVSLLAIRPGLPRAELKTMLKNTLEDFEIDLILKWVESAGVGEPVGYGETRSIRLGEWWYLCIAEDKGKKPDTGLVTTA